MHAHFTKGVHIGFAKVACNLSTIIKNMSKNNTGVLISMHFYCCKSESAQIRV